MLTLKQYINEQLNREIENELTYEAPEKLNNNWIDNNSVSHEFNCGRGKIRLKDGVDRLSHESFIGCDKLTSVCIPSFINIIDEDAFTDCKNIQPVQIPFSVKKFGNHILSDYRRDSIDLKDKYNIINGDLTWDYMHNLYIPFSLDEQPQKRLLISPADNLYDLHDDNTTGSRYTDEELDRLIKGISDYMRSGEVLTAHGGLTPGGLSLIKRFTNYPFTKVGENCLSWSSKICRQYGIPDDESWMNQQKLIKWLNNPSHKDDFKIIDRNKPLDDENTYPIAWVLKRN